jgi:hypothetical protein
MPPADQQAAASFLAVFVQTLAHFLAWLEMRDALWRYCHRNAGAGIAASAAIPRSGREGAKASKFDSPTTCETITDRFEDEADDLVDFLHVELRVAGSELLYELRSYHDAISLIGRSLSIFCCAQTTTSHPNVIVL